MRGRGRGSKCSQQRDAKASILTGTPFPGQDRPPSANPYPWSHSLSRTTVRFLLGSILVLTLSASVLADDCPSVTFSLEQTLSGYPSYVEYLQVIDYDHDGKLDLVGAFDLDDINFS